MDDDAGPREPRRSSGPRSREVREEAARLRREGLTEPTVVERLGVHLKTPAGVVPRRRGPRTAALRREGVERAEIARRLEVGVSPVARWFREDGVELVARGLPGRAAAVAAHRRVTDERWAAQDAEQAEHASSVGPLSHRELLLVGAALHWAEGAKAKPWRRDHRVTLINGEPAVLRLFIVVLEHLGVSRSDIVRRLQIHQTADVQAAQAWRREQGGADLAFHRRGVPGGASRRWSAAARAPAGGWSGRGRVLLSSSALVDPPWCNGSTSYFG